MEVIEIVLHAPSRYVSYAFLTDTHIGVVNCDEEYLSRTIATIADDPTCWWFFGGDAAEFINYSDRRWDSRTAADWLKVKDLGNLANVQLDYFMQIIAPIRDKCLGGHPGNHEELIYRKYHLDIMDRLCRELPMRNLSCVAQIRLRIDRDGQSPLYYDIYSTHGCSGKLAGWANKVRAGFDADIYQRGHLHSEKQWFVAPHLGMRRSGNPHTLQRMQLFLTGGSYYRTYMKGITSYGERREYPPAALGSLKVTFDTETGKFWCSEVC